MNRFTEKQHIGTSKEGTVNFFSNPHGFGFINLKDTKENIFVHISHLNDVIKENDKVVFDIIQGVKGMIATKVRLI
ncbi:MAG: cold shock domain-containing protein [Aquaticitalea sp.]